MVLDEWLGFASRILYRVLCLCHWQKHHHLDFVLCLLWLLDSAFDDSIYAKTTTKRSSLSSMVYGLGRA